MGLTFCQGKIFSAEGRTLFLGMTKDDVEFLLSLGRYIMVKELISVGDVLQEIDLPRVNGESKETISIIQDDLSIIIHFNHGEEKQVRYVGS